MRATSSNSHLLVERVSPDAVLIRVSGNCRGQLKSHSVEVARQALDQTSGLKCLSFETTTLTGWDSRLIAFLRNCAELCRERNVEFHDEGLTDGIRRLLRLAQAVPERSDARQAAVRVSFLQRIGEHVLKG